MADEVLHYSQQSPDVWIIDLSERKASILLDELKLQTEKKPVELRGWPEEEREVRSFLDCLPYISELSYKYFPCDEEDRGLKYAQVKHIDFLLDCYSQVTGYETQTGRSFLPALKSIFQSPDVWPIDLSKRKTSILLEVLKLQTEKKRVELRGWTEEESEVMSFLHCLPYISQLRFYRWNSDLAVHYVSKLFIKAEEIETQTKEKMLEQLTIVCTYTSFPYEHDESFHQNDFLLDLCSQLKSQSGGGLLQALKPVYIKASPDVWSIDLSKRNASILLEVLKLQTENKPVKLRGWTEEESEVRSFLHCLPFISQLSVDLCFDVLPLEVREAISEVIQRAYEATHTLIELKLDCLINTAGIHQLFTILEFVKLKCDQYMLHQFLSHVNAENAESLSRALGEEVDLSDTHLDLQACGGLALVLYHSEGLTELDLSQCHLTDDSLTPLLRNLHKAQTIDFSGNSITDSGAQNIYINVHNSNIQTVRLSKNKIESSYLFHGDPRFKI